MKTTPPAPFTPPTINLNGDSRDSLERQTGEILEAGDKLLKYLCANAPHGRNYQLKPGTYEAARAENEAMRESVVAVIRYYEKMAEVICDHNMARNSRIF